MTIMRRRHREVLLPEKVAEEVGTRGSSLERFLNRYPDVITSFSPEEEVRYLEMRAQEGIGGGEAAAIAVALVRNIPLVIDDKRGRGKAENHDIRCLNWSQFIEGHYPG